MGKARSWMFWAYFGCGANMLYVMYLWILMIINLLITVLLAKLKVEQANAKLLEEKVL